MPQTIRTDIALRRASVVSVDSNFNATVISATGGQTVIPLAKATPVAPGTMVYEVQLPTKQAVLLLPEQLPVDLDLTCPKFLVR